jgi:hypothetical protein
MLAFFALGVLCTNMETSAGQPDQRRAKKAWHAGKAGLYLRLPPEKRKEATLLLTHPLVDAVVANYEWGELEPQAGAYNFRDIDYVLSLCKRYHKGMLLQIATYGQSPARMQTPSWVYARGVKGIRFHGGGDANGQLVTSPRIWDSQPYLENYDKLIRRLAERYSRDSTIWYIVPGIGLIGTTVAQPSVEGGQVFEQEGWTPQLWGEHTRQVIRRYQDAFPTTPLMVMASNILLRDRSHDHYRRELRDLLLELGQNGVSVLAHGLDPDIDRIRQNEVLAPLVPLASLAVSGSIRLGLGDDWPLWVPPERRRDRHLASRDEAGLKRMLDYAFGGVQGLPRTHISTLYVLHPEIEASHPARGSQQNRSVYDILRTARQRLLDEDPISR